MDDTMMPGAGDGGKTEMPAPPRIENAVVAEAMQEIAGGSIHPATPSLPLVSGHATTSHSRFGDSPFAQSPTFQSQGRFVRDAIPWHNANGDLEFVVTLTDLNIESPVSSDPAPVYLDTLLFTPSAGTVSESLTHGLGEDWQGFRATNHYVNGTLEVEFYTDAKPSDDLVQPFLLKERRDYTIALDEFPFPPTVPAGSDSASIAIWIHQLAGSLEIDGAEKQGTFSCEGLCFFSYGPLLRSQGWLAFGDTVVFTPADEGEDTVRLSGETERLGSQDYLSFGSWLYVPDNVVEREAFDFGIFASGGDAFTVTNIAGLTGSADYIGDATGYYAYAEERTNMVSFAADARLRAEFGDSTELGTISGTVDGFKTASGDLLNLPVKAVSLTADTPWREDCNSICLSNIEGTTDAIPGGRIIAIANAEDAEGGTWYGNWGGKFYGNDDASGYPISFAGTFAVRGPGDDSRSLVGAFGAHYEPPQDGTAQ